MRRLLFIIAIGLTSPVSASPLLGRLPGDSAGSFRVLAVSPSGSASIAKISPSGKFRINTRSGVSLQLLSSSGSYYGPVVMGGRTSANTHLNGSTGNIGELKLNDGFATVRRSRRRSRLFNSKRVSFNSTTGTPGSGKLGLVQVQSSASRFVSRASGNARPGIDSDRDGIPNAFDVDDNGDLVFDSVDPAAFDFNDLFPEVFSDLSVEMYETLNINAAEVSTEDIDDLIYNNLSLVFLVIPNEVEVTSVDLDCSGLPYCNSETGTAVIRGPQESPNLPIGELLRNFDNNSNGYPDLATRSNPSGFEIGFFPRVKTRDIASGDSYIFHIATTKGLRRIPVTLPYYFVTTTALASYDDGSGIKEISYPVSQEGAGSPASPITLASTSLTVNVWRPQRPAIAGAESGSYVDMGGLQYGVYLAVDSDVYRCAPADFSQPSPELEFLTSAEDTSTREAIFRDTSVDRSPSSQNVLSYTIDLQSCLSRNGQSTNGKRIILDLLAKDNDQNNTFQHVHLQLP
ncbi:MAG: hypothetical protein KDD60_00670 [Bdellovibrionales bacterium]|nr:hypothetical protein [Bdellovibrionales bacterium]